jgi:hypothetical protein
VAADPATTTPEAEAPQVGGLEKKANKEFADDTQRFKAGAKRDRSLDGLVGGSVGGGGSTADGAGSTSTRAGRKAVASEKDANRNTPDTASNLSARRGPKKTKTKPTVDSTKRVIQGKGKSKGPAPKAPPVSKPKLDDREVTSKDKAAPRPEPSPAPATDPAPPPPAGNTTGSDNKSSEPKRPADQSAEDDGDSEGEESRAAAEPPKSPEESKTDAATSAAALHKKAITAAKKNQCSKVKSIGQQIRKLSSSYYDRTFLSDKRLTACLAPEVKK